MTTIRELAKLTGYSTSMISRVLNRYPYVDEQKRNEILKAIAETNYRPNSMARNLSLGKTQNIGVIVPYVHMPYFEQISKGIFEEAFRQNYKVTLLPTKHEQKIEKQYLEEFATKLYDGLIITSRANPLKILEYQQYGPIVFCESIQQKNCASVSINREKAFFDTVAYFNRHRITKIGIITGRNEHNSASAKQLVKLANAYFPSFDSTYIFRNCTNYETGLQAAAYFDEKKVQGIITNGDEISAAIHQFYQGKDLPLIVGQDNLLISQLLNLTTIDYHLSECGKQAFTLFVSEEQKHIEINPTFIER